MKASWADQCTIVISEERLRDLLATIRVGGRPVMLFLEDEGGATFVAGIGAPESVLTFVQPDGRSFHSVGDTSRTGHLLFLCRDQLDEFMAEMAIPQDIAIEALFAFFASGVRPSNVQWEADW